MNVNCNASGLEAYIPGSQKPWNEMRAKHFYRRFAFGGKPTMIKEALTRTPSDLIDDLIDQAVAMTPNPDPGWGYLDYDESIDYVGSVKPYNHLRGQFLYMMFNDFRNDHIRAQMTMFMTGLFVSANIKNMAAMFQSYVMKQKYALGNFKDFIHELGLDPLMIRYLNNFENKAGKPNENYARELYELFTLGVDNGYTEADIKETARAITGYNIEKTRWGEIEFNPNTFDDGEKTIFGQTGNWGYSDVIDILFEQRPQQIATYICGKLYEYFVSHTPNEDIIAGMAQTFLANNFEFAPVLRQLFKSEHFFDEAAIGVLVKTPIELAIMHDNEVGYLLQDKDSFPLSKNLWPNRVALALEMSFISPPNVSGWIKDIGWINSVTIAERIAEMRDYSKDQNKLPGGPEVYANFAKALFDVNENADVVARGIVDFCLSKKGLYESEYQDAIAVFKEGVPDNYFEDGAWSLNYQDLSGQVKNLLDYVFALPEFQLK